MLVEYLLIGLTSVIGVIGFLLLRAVRTESVKSHSDAEVMETIVEKLEDLRPTSQQPEPVLARIEELERRMERVHKDSLAYLQKAAATEQRLKQRQEYDEDAEEDTALTEAQAKALLDKSDLSSHGMGDQGRLSVAELEALAR